MSFSSSTSECSGNSCFESTDDLFDSSKTEEEASVVSTRSYNWYNVFTRNPNVEVEVDDSMEKSGTKGEKRISIFKNSKTKTICMCSLICLLLTIILVLSVFAVLLATGVLARTESVGVFQVAEKFHGTDIIRLSYSSRDYKLGETEFRVEFKDASSLFVSNLATDEYECVGSCVYTTHGEEEDDDEKRRNSLSATKLVLRTFPFIIGALSSFAAAQSYKKYLDEEFCPSSSTHDQEFLQSEVSEDECHLLEHSSVREVDYYSTASLRAKEEKYEEEFLKEYHGDEDHHLYRCCGRCMPKKFFRMLGYGKPLGTCEEAFKDVIWTFNYLTEYSAKERYEKVRSDFDGYLDDYCQEYNIQFGGDEDRERTDATPCEGGFDHNPDVECYQIHPRSPDQDINKEIVNDIRWNPKYYIRKE